MYIRLTAFLIAAINAIKSNHLTALILPIAD